MRWRYGPNSPKQFQSSGDRKYIQDYIGFVFLGFMIG